jgi:GTPase SAR1 family protein
MVSSGPRILLFGPSGSGKSSLLGALAQVASSQPVLLKGNLVEESGALAELQNRIDSGTPDATDKLTAYDIHLKSESGKSQAEATILDSSGKVDQQMLASKKPFLDSHPMKQPALTADTVVLVLDASLPGKQLAEEFQQFGRWLMQFHETRGRYTEVGHLPVYLVLNKCDLLAKQNDTFSMWLQRIEEGKRKIDQKFHEYLQTQGVGFGTIDLRIWATAIKRPALSDRPAKTEPYGVAELFRQCMQSASNYAERRHVSQYRLHKIVSAGILTVALLVSSVALLVEFQPQNSRPSNLDEKVYALLPKKERWSDRLRGSIKNLEMKRDALNAIANDDDFRHLPEETQETVKNYHKDLEEYLKFYNEKQTKLKQPHQAKNEKEYFAMKKDAESVELPKNRLEDWKNTKLDLRIQQIHMEFAQVDLAIKDENKWYDDQKMLNEKLLKQGSAIYVKILNEAKLEPQEGELWNLSVREQMQPKSRKPRDEYISGTRMTYDDLDRFEQIKKAQQNWIDSRAELKTMADNIFKRLK